MTWRAEEVRFVLSPLSGFERAVSDGGKTVLLHRGRGASFFGRCAARASCRCGGGRAGKARQPVAGRPTSGRPAEPAVGGAGAEGSLCGIWRPGLRAHAPLASITSSIASSIAPASGSVRTPAKNSLFCRIASSSVRISCCRCANV